jgi:hypothetical protein
MTVKDAMDTIESAKECMKFLSQLANAEQDEHTKDYLRESFDLLGEYTVVLEQMKVQRA